MVFDCANAMFGVSGLNNTRQQRARRRAAPHRIARDTPHLKLSFHLIFITDTVSSVVLRWMRRGLYRSTGIPNYQ